MVEGLLNAIFNIGRALSLVAEQVQENNNLLQGEYDILLFRHGDIRGEMMGKLTAKLCLIGHLYDGERGRDAKPVCRNISL